MHQPIDLFTIILHACLALMGALVREIRDWEKDRSIPGFIGGALCGAFLGVLAYLICNSIGMDGSMTAAIAGIFGYGSYPMLDALEKRVRHAVKNKDISKKK